MRASRRTISSWRGYKGLIPARQDFGSFYAIDFREGCRLTGSEFNRSVQHQLQSIGRGFEGQGLSRALIEPQSNGIEVGLGEAREIGSSREVLSQQAVGVLVTATLPWTA